MRSYQCLLLCLFSIKVHANQQLKHDNHFVLDGVIHNCPVAYKYIYLIIYNSNEERITDSCEVKKGAFKFSGAIDGFSNRVYLKLNVNNLANNDSLNNVQVFLENTHMRIDLEYANFSKFKILGSYSYDRLLKLRKETDNIKNVIETLSMSIDSADSAVTKRQIEVLKNRIFDINVAYCKDNPESNLSPFLLYSYGNQLNYNDLTTLYLNFSEFQQKSYYGKKIATEIEIRKSVLTQVGTKAPLFITTDINNTLIRLDSIFKEKYVLLDFWASWCSPCRAFNSRLKAIYNRYSTLGLEIIAVADDIGQENKWEKAVYDDGINIWINVLRTADKAAIKNNRTDIYDAYKVETLPTKILIDKNGIIIGRYDANNQNELETRLKEVLPDNDLK